jgi:hypothetical protein
MLSMNFDVSVETVKSGGLEMTKVIPIKFWRNYVISGEGDSRAGSATSKNLFSSLSILKAEKGLFIYFYFQLNMDTVIIQCKLEIEIKHGGKKIVEIEQKNLWAHVVFLEQVEELLPCGKEGFINYWIRLILITISTIFFPPCLISISSLHWIFIDGH